MGFSGQADLAQFLNDGVGQLMKTYDPCGLVEQFRLWQKLPPQRFSQNLAECGRTGQSFACPAGDVLFFLVWRDGDETLVITQADELSYGISCQPACCPGSLAGKAQLF